LSFSLFQRLERKRISRLLYDQLSLGLQLDKFWGDILGIADAMKGLDGVGVAARMKAPAPLKHPLLKGLWRAHYFTSRFIQENLENELKKVMSDDHQNTEWGADIQMAIDTGKDLREAANQIALRTTWGAYRARSNANELTGEWIIYAKDAAGKNHYMCVTHHEAGGRHIHNLIRRRCEPRFLAVMDAAR
jgi:hypothetical protein